MSRTSHRSPARTTLSGPADATAHSTLIGTEALARRIDDRDAGLVVVDVRHMLADPEHWGEAEYAKGHLPGAVFAHVDRELSAAKNGRNGRHPLPTPEAAADTFGRLGIGPSSQVVAYDQDNGMYAARLWWMLRWLGHDAVAVLDGGYAQWTREGRPVETAAARRAHARFTPHAVLPTVSATGVAASLPRHALLLLDARGAERYRGDVEPLDAVAGHIPGAINRPYTRNVGADGRFRAAHDLREEFEGMLHGRSADDLVHYCGSGISACHNVLAMAVAGYPLTRLYPGSWSEWSSNPKRPVAKGQV
ncbi:MAG: sulfurtransferase [Proteobacteria bacterium]|jgi:thiosulfate/3-mercaptopyruvate sulfurtransferase|nr:sulfurtransferase [Pseudomonadota bacterium]